MSILENFDVIVIGSGQGGDPFARDCAKAGRRTALIERVHVGGTCINTGCTPTKTMIASARVAYLARRASAYGVQTGRVRVDMTAVRERKRKIVKEFRESSEEKDTHTPNLELIRGEAAFLGPKEVRVNGRSLGAGYIVIDTGCRAKIPPIPGLEVIPYLDSENVMELDAAPRHLIILGGGYIGAEFAQMFRRLGSRVTVIQRENQLVEREDADVAQALEGVFQGDGIDVILNADVSRVDPGPTVHLRGNGRNRAVHGTAILVATGRTPNIEKLGLKLAGIETSDRGFVKVDERLETSQKGVYAIGDVNGGPQFTHISYDDYRILKANILGEGGCSTKGRMVPYAVFTDPQLGRIGLSEREAREAGIDYKIARMPMSSVARALEVDETRGFMKAIVDPDTKKVLGFAGLGLEGGEIMNMVQIAMLGGLPYTALRDGIFAHPTLGEALNNLFAELKSPGR